MKQGLEFVIDVCSAVAVYLEKMLTNSERNGLAVRAAKIAKHMEYVSTSILEPGDLANFLVSHMANAKGVNTPHHWDQLRQYMEHRVNGVAAQEVTKGATDVQCRAAYVPRITARECLDALFDGDILVVDKNRPPGFPKVFFDDAPLSLIFDPAEISGHVNSIVARGATGAKEGSEIVSFEMGSVVEGLHLLVREMVSSMDFNTASLQLKMLVNLAYYPTQRFEVALTATVNASASKPGVTFEALLGADGEIADLVRALGSASVRVSAKNDSFEDSEGNVRKLVQGVVVVEYKSVPNVLEKERIVRRVPGMLMTYVTARLAERSGLAAQDFSIRVAKQEKGKSPWYEYAMEEMVRQGKTELKGIAEAILEQKIEGVEPQLPKAGPRFEVMQQLRAVRQGFFGTSAEPLTEQCLSRVYSFFVLRSWSDEALDREVYTAACEALIQERPADWKLNIPENYQAFLGFIRNRYLRAKYLEPYAQDPTRLHLLEELLRVEKVYVPLEYPPAYIRFLLDERRSFQRLADDARDGVTVKCSTLRVEKQEEAFFFNEMCLNVLHPSSFERVLLGMHVRSTNREREILRVIEVERGFEYEEVLMRLSIDFADWLLVKAGRPPTMPHARFPVHGMSAGAWSYLVTMQELKPEVEVRRLQSGFGVGDRFALGPRKPVPKNSPLVGWDGLPNVGRSDPIDWGVDQNHGEGAKEKSADRQRAEAERAEENRRHNEEAAMDQYREEEWQRSRERTEEAAEASAPRERTYAPSAITFTVLDMEDCLYPASALNHKWVTYPVFSNRVFDESMAEGGLWLEFLFDKWRQAGALCTNDTRRRFFHGVFPALQPMLVGARHGGLVDEANRHLADVYVSWIGAAFLQGVEAGEASERKPGEAVPTKVVVPTDTPRDEEAAFEHLRKHERALPWRLFAFRRAWHQDRLDTKFTFAKGLQEYPAFEAGFDPTLSRIAWATRAQVAAADEISVLGNWQVKCKDHLHAAVKAVVDTSVLSKIEAQPHVRAAHAFLRRSLEHMTREYVATDAYQRATQIITAWTKTYNITDRDRVDMVEKSRSEAPPWPPTREERELVTEGLRTMIQCARPLEWAILSAYTVADARMDVGLHRSKFDWFFEGRGYEWARLCGDATRTVAAREVAFSQLAEVARDFDYARWSKAAVAMGYRAVRDSLKTLVDAGMHLGSSPSDWAADRLLYPNPWVEAYAFSLTNNQPAGRTFFEERRQVPRGIFHTFLYAARFDNMAPLCLQWMESEKNARIQRWIRGIPKTTTDKSLCHYAVAEITRVEAGGVDEDAFMLAWFVYPLLSEHSKGLFLRALDTRWNEVNHSFVEAVDRPRVLRACKAVMDGR